MSKLFASLPAAIASATAAHHAILSRENARSLWVIDLYDDGNIARSNKAFPKRFRTAGAAFSALWEAYLDAKAGKRHPRFAGRTLAQELNAVARTYRKG